MEPTSEAGRNGLKLFEGAKEIPKQWLGGVESHGPAITRPASNALRWPFHSAVRQPRSKTPSPSSRMGTLFWPAAAPGVADQTKGADAGQHEGRGFGNRLGRPGDHTEVIDIIGCG